MSIYNSLNFISSYNPNNIYITILDSFGKKVHGINICKYESFKVKSKTLLINLSDRNPIELEFSSKGEALQAGELLQTVVETLQPNCSIIPTPGDTPVVQPITLSQYKALQLTSGLVAFQWYDVADISNVFNLGPTLRVQALSINDYQPKGILPNSNIAIKVNVIDDTIQFYEDSEYKILRLNNSNVITLDNTNYYLQSQNNSLIVAQNNSEKIYANNSSNLIVNNCSNILADNSSVNIANASNCKFYNISNDLSLVTGLNNIIVDKTNTVGKKGIESFQLNNDDLISYVNLTNIVLDNSLLDANYVKKLKNYITDANAEFIFEVIASLAKTNYTVEIQDKNGNTLYTINNGDIDKKIFFRYNKVTDKFELFYINNRTLENYEKIDVLNDNDTTFALSRIVNKPNLSKLFVNGQLQEYGVLNDFYIQSGNQLVWTNRNFKLKTYHILQYYFE